MAESLRMTITPADVKRNKIVKGGAAYARNTEFSGTTGSTWRVLYKLWQAGGLPARYREMLPSPRVTQQRLQRGDLVYDDTLMKILRAHESP